jgi:hypothetical protein
MITVALLGRVARGRGVAVVAAVAAFLVATGAARVEAQVGIGLAYPGLPFLYYTPQSAPSPTDYLYDRSNQYISAYGNAVQQQAAASQMAPASASPDAYFHRLRDYSGEGTYQVRSRQSLSERTSTAARQGGTASISTPATRQPTAFSPPRALPLDAFFHPNGELDWPRDAPDSGVLGPARVEAEMAIKAVRSEIQSVGKAKAQSVGTAKRRLVNYGQRALIEVKSARSVAVHDVFHYFLLFLHQALDQAGTGES